MATWALLSWGVIVSVASEDLGRCAPKETPNKRAHHPLVKDKEDSTGSCQTPGAGFLLFCVERNLIQKTRLVENRGH